MQFKTSEQKSNKTRQKFSIPSQYTHSLACAQKRKIIFLISLVSISAALLYTVAAYSLVRDVSAQIPGLPPLNTSPNATIQPNISPFEGESIKIIAFNSFSRVNEWESIDSLASSGYDIKSVVQSGDRFFVILEKQVE